MRLSALAAWLLGALVLTCAPAAAEDARYCLDTRPENAFPALALNPVSGRYEQVLMGTHAPCDHLERQEGA